MGMMHKNGANNNESVSLYPSTIWGDFVKKSIVIFYGLLLRNNNKIGFVTINNNNGDDFTIFCNENKKVG